MTTEEITDEVAVALMRKAGLLHAPALTRQVAQSLAREAMSRLRVIRDREGADPLPHD